MSDQTELEPPVCPCSDPASTHRVSEHFIEAPRPTGLVPFYVADDQRTGQADTAPQAHIDEPPVQWCTCEGGAYLGAQKLGTPPRCERCGFLPDYPWVHAAMLDALVRAGVLTEDTRVLDDGMVSMVQRWGETAATVTSRQNTKQRRLVTAWEPA